MFVFKTVQPPLDQPPGDWSLQNVIEEINTVNKFPISTASDSVFVINFI